MSFPQLLLLSGQFVFALLLGVLGAVATGQAQPFGRTVVIPVESGGTEQSLPMADTLESALAERHVSLISLHEARDRFVRRSRPPREVSESDLDVLTREAHEAVEHVAFGRSAAAQRSVREVLQRAEHALESLNRETVHARQLLDACLSLVRNSLREGQRDEAIEQATRCRKLVPDLAPSEATHPSNVVGVLTEADDRLRRMRIGKLSVQAKPPANCSVYVNGRHLGTTPFELDAAAVGEYRVQVECGSKLGRVHLVQLGEAPVELVVDASLDRAVASEPRLMLRYSNDAALREHVVDHATQLGQQLAIDDVLLMHPRARELVLLRIRVSQQRVLGRTALKRSAGEGIDRAQLQKALATLAEARIEGDWPIPGAQPSGPPSNLEQVSKTETEAGVTASSPAPAAVPAAGLVPEAPTSPQPSQSQEPPRARRRTGYALLVSAVGLYAVGLGFEGQRWKLDNELYYRPPSDRAAMNERYDRAAALRWLGLGGGALGVVAAALLAEPHATIPWWSYALGAAGIALGSVGIYEVATGHACESRDEQGCALRKNSQGLGALLLAAGAPLIAVPIAHLARAPGGHQASLRILPVAHGSVISLAMVH